ncbi:MAG: hypothetical protein ACRED5_04135 [Propylenella sp.]
MSKILRTSAFLSVAVLLMSLNPANADVDGLRSFVAMKAAVVDLLHTKAERALVTAAQDQTFRQYFEAKTDSERASLRDRIDHISLAVQSKFAVEEMCLIDETGTEISRVVKNEIAYDLSTEEASANFFAPTFAEKPREVYLAPIYVSPDVHRWVTAYATPVDVHGQKRAILHYEHGLDFYERTLKAGVDPDGERVFLTATADGWVILDSRKKISIEQIGESEEPADYFEQLSIGGLSLTELKTAVAKGETEGAATLEAQNGQKLDVAFKTLGDWVLVAFEPSKEQSS